MKNLLLTLLDLAVTTAKLCGPGGVRAVIAENLLLKQQLIVLRRARQRAPNLTLSDRLLCGFGSLFLSPGRIRKVAIGVRPSTLLAFHQALAQATDRPALVGTMTMIGGLATFLSPIGGTLADRYSRKWLLVLLDLLSGGAILTLAALFFAFPGRIALLVAALFVVNIIREICTTFFQPTAMAIVPDIVPPERLPAANACVDTTDQAIMFVGQGAGGVLFRILGAPSSSSSTGSPSYSPGSARCSRVRQRQERRSEEAPAAPSAPSAPSGSTLLIPCYCRNGFS